MYVVYFTIQLHKFKSTITTTSIENLKYKKLIYRRKNAITCTRYGPQKNTIIGTDTSVNMDASEVTIKNTREYLKCYSNSNQ